MVINQNELGALDFLNNDRKLDLFTNNVVLEDFTEFNDCMDCKYFNETTFAVKYANTNDLLFLNSNIQSLAAKFTNLCSFFDHMSNANCLPDIFSLQEIWKIQPDFYQIEGYKFFSKTRNEAQGGGVGIYTKSNYNVSILEEVSYFIENVFESLVLKVEIPNIKKFICVSLYKPPGCKFMTTSRHMEIFFNYLNEMLQKLEKFKLPVYILTDSNIDLMKIGVNEHSSDLFNTMLGFGFFQIIGKSTRVTNETHTLIDQIYTSDKVEYLNSGVIIDSLSDHFITFCSIKQNKAKNSKGPSFVYKRNFDVHNKEVFKNYISTLTWNNVIASNCPNEAYDIFWDDFYNIFELSFPKKKVKINRNKHCINKFMTKGLMKSRRTKLNLSAKAKRSNDDKLKYISYRNLYNSILKKAKAIYYREAIENANGDSKKIWKTINEACNKTNKSNKTDKLNVNGVIINDETEIANAFNNHFSQIGEKVSAFIPNKDIDFRQYLPNPTIPSLFLAPVSPGEILEVIMNMGKKTSQDVNDIPFPLLQFVVLELLKPLTHIFNLSIEKGIFPANLKTSKVVAIYKNSGSPLDVNYHRGIAIVNQVSKVFEKLICRRLLNFLYTNDFFDENQFGFLKDRSTNHAILKIINYITESINHGDYVVGVFLDAMKAFDSVNHDILLSKLDNAGIRGNALNWFKSYLSGRNQKVKVGESWSELQNINISVLQGSILGVILFIIFINDLHRASDKALTVLFADDATPLFSHSNLNELNVLVNEELSKICDWYSANKLALHPDKSKFILFKSKYDNLEQLSINNASPYFPLYLNMNDSNECNITKIKMIKHVPNSDEKSVRALGVLLDQDLTLVEHVKSLHSKLSRNLYSLRQISNLFPTPILKLVYKANFQSHINYCSNILSMCTKTTLDPIIKMQKKAIRLVSKVKYNESTTPLFKEHNILPIMQQIEYSSLMIMHDYLNETLSPSFYPTWIRNNHLNGNYNLRNGNDIHIRPHRYEYLKKHPIFNFGILWNNLNDELKSIEDRNLFAKSIKSKLINALQ